jgi:hypothetical protein
MIVWIDASSDGFIYTAHDNKELIKWKKMHIVSKYLGNN